MKSILSSVEDPGHRVWKVVDQSGAVRQNKKKINTTRKLKQFLGNQPDKVYVSISRFMAPEQCYGKKPKHSQWTVRDSWFLGSELYFDFDSENNLRQAWNDCKAMIKAMKQEKDYKLIQVTFSGNKGYNLIYKDLKPVKISHPLHRLELTELRRKQLLKRLPKFQTLDNLSHDQYRVRACPNTIKANTGCKVTIIKGDRIVRPRPMIDKTSPNKQGKERSILISYPFISNQVKGMKGMYIPVLKYPINNPNLVLAKKIQQIYKLSDLHVFEYKDTILYISFKIVDKRRLEKILKAARSLNNNSFLFYKHIWIPLDMQYLGTIKSPVKVKGGFSNLNNNRKCKALRRDVLWWVTQRTTS